MSAYDAAGKRNSSKTHARRGHPCSLCDEIPFGNGGWVSHGRKHVRRGEAVELVKYYGYGLSSSRMFLAPDDPKIPGLLAGGSERVGA